MKVNELGHRCITRTVDNEDEVSLRPRPFVQIVVYYITGKQLGPLSVPYAWCEECDLTIRTVKRAAAHAGLPESAVEAKPWLRHVVAALKHGGWHPPVVLIDGRVFSQGVVPDEDALTTELSRLTTCESYSTGRQVRK